MSVPDAGTLLDRLAAARKQRESELAANRRPPTTAADRFGSPYAIGDRVFDTITGSHGRIARVDPAPSGGGLELVVQLDGGTLVTREPSTLINRPSER